MLYLSELRYRDTGLTGCAAMQSKWQGLGGPAATYTENQEKPATL